MVICYLGAGSNLGDRSKNLRQALRKINLLKNTKVIKHSLFFQTAPVGGPIGQPDFLNAVFKIKTRLSPANLLKALKIIEKQLGRVNSVKNGPRKIDLDILLYGDKVVKQKRLIIPHPRMFERDFVTKPLLEVI